MAATQTTQSPVRTSRNATLGIIAQFCTGGASAYELLYTHVYTMSAAVIIIST